jgi:hypothetical protein
VDSRHRGSLDGVLAFFRGYTVAAIDRATISPVVAFSTVRLWTIHPKYLDPQSLVALWREGLLVAPWERGAA